MSIMIRRENLLLSPSRDHPDFGQTYCAVSSYTVFKRQLLVCYWDLVATASVIEGQKIILTLKIPIVSNHLLHS